MINLRAGAATGTAILVWNEESQSRNISEKSHRWKHSWNSEVDPDWWTLSVETSHAAGMLV